MGWGHVNEIYNEEYFEYGLKTGKSGYENYHWMPERIYREIRSVIFKLGIKPDDRVLDYGCAKGYWVKGLRHYGIDAYGVDISEYALSHADKEVKGYLYNKPLHDKYDYIVSRNTFEHIPELELKKLLQRFFNMTDVVFFTVPLAKSNGGEYIMQALDTTHEIKWTNEKWISFCHECGWGSIENLYQIEGIHDKWDSYPNSIGFYILRKNQNGE
jgi:cyclopropane fatty-acyl-phospholipid synthase-like methyltransferase